MNSQVLIPKNLNQRNAALAIQHSGKTWSKEPLWIDLQDPESLKSHIDDGIQDRLISSSSDTF